MKFLIIFLFFCVFFVFGNVIILYSDDKNELNQFDELLHREVEGISGGGERSVKPIDLFNLDISKDGKVVNGKVEIFKSSSGQFIVLGGDFRFRSVISNYAENVKKRLLDVLGLNDLWKYQIYFSSIKASDYRVGSGAEKIRFEVVSVQDSYILKIIIPTLYEFDIDLLFRKVVRAVFLEIYLRGGGDLSILDDQISFKNVIRSDFKSSNSNEEGNDLMHFPDWILEGLLRLCNSRNKGENDFGLYDSVLKLGDTFLIKDIILGNFKREDSFSEMIYRVSCEILVSVILDSGSGSEQLVNFIGGVQDSDKEFIEDHYEIFENYFPSLVVSSNSLSKLWSLKLLDIIKTKKELILPPLKSRELFLDVMDFSPFVDKQKKIKKKNVRNEFNENYDVVSYFQDELVKEKKKKFVAVVSSKRNLLIDLKFRIFPDYKFLIDDYNKIFSEVLSNDFYDSFKSKFSSKKFSKKKNIIVSKLLSLKRKELDMFTIYKKVKNELDSYTINELDLLTDKFDVFFKQIDKIYSLKNKYGSGGVSRGRSDPISEYIDFFEEQN